MRAARARLERTLLPSEGDEGAGVASCISSLRLHTSAGYRPIAPVVRPRWSASWTNRR
jgi:hypothetical protein